jgi:GxxExxY protein
MKPRDCTRLAPEIKIEPDNGKWLFKDLTEKIIGSAMEVHRELHSGFLEYVYKEALCHELDLQKINYDRQKDIDIYYKDFVIPKKYRPDLLVEGKVLVEIKSTSGLILNDEAQLLHYLKVTKVRVGLLLNFGANSLEIRRMVL